MLAAYGSLLFIDRANHPAQYDLGAMVFTVANIINICVGIHIGDLVLVSSQAGLMYFTLPMYKNKVFSMICSVGAITLMYLLSVAESFHFTASYLGAACSIIAISGAWFMSKCKFTPMAWCWLIADIGFIVVAVLNHLPMLGVLAMVFVYHSSLRLLGYKRTGLFSFAR
jgi:hypothetical protein